MFKFLFQDGQIKKNLYIKEKLLAQGVHLNPQTIHGAAHALIRPTLTGTKTTNYLFIADQLSLGEKIKKKNYLFVYFQREKKLNLNRVEKKYIESNVCVYLSISEVFGISLVKMLERLM